MKTCKKCNEEKELNEFNWMKPGPRTSKTGYYVGTCKACMKVYTKSLNMPSWSPEKQRNRWLKHAYGITLEEYDTFVIKQNNKCAICRDDPDEGKPLSVDHCHATNKIRGLLCQKCNKGLGHFRDDVAILQQSIDYLNRG